jgi:hypothetical protein
MRALLFALIFHSAAFLIPGFSQMKYDRVWVTGYEAGGGTQGPIVMDFNYSPMLLRFPFLPKFQGTRNSATICDEEGNLRAFTNGCSLFNRDFEMMANGDSLNIGFIWSWTCCCSGNPYYPPRNGCIFLPHPENKEEVYLVHARADWILGWSVLTEAVLYSRIDFLAEEGKGKVVEKNVPILEDSLIVGMLEVCRHANGRDWWILQWENGRNTYYRIHFAFEERTVYPLESIGAPVDSALGKIKYSAFSPDGKQYAIYNSRDQVYLYDFDDATGLLSNWRQIVINEEPGFDNPGGISFSPSAQFLYVSAIDKVYQIDTWSADPQGSVVVVGQYDGWKYKDAFPANFFPMEFGPDCRIYIGSTSSTPYLHVIHQPDKKGLDCQFEQRGLMNMPPDSLRLNGAALPNMAWYRSGTGYPLCDSSIQLVSSVISEDWRPVAMPLEVFPNPVIGHQVWIRTQDARLSGEVSVRLLDIYGGEAGRWRQEIRVNEVIPLSWPGHLPAGFYVLHLENVRGEQWRQMLMVGQ